MITVPTEANLTRKVFYGQLSDLEKRIGHAAKEKTPILAATVFKMNYEGFLKYDVVMTLGFPNGEPLLAAPVNNHTYQLKGDFLVPVEKSLHLDTIKKIAPKNGLDTTTTFPPLKIQGDDLYHYNNPLNPETSYTKSLAVKIGEEEILQFLGSWKQQYGRNMKVFEKALAYR